MGCKVVFKSNAIVYEINLDMTGDGSSMNNEFTNAGKILMYQNEKGDTKADVYFEDDTVWMTQKSMAELYQVTPQNITLHVKHIYEDQELEEASTCKEYLQVQVEGVRTVQRSAH